MSVLSRQLHDAAGGLVRRAAAPQQAGIFVGENPSKYNASDPIQLWVIQVVVIIGMTQLLSLLFARIRQPRVIAEVIGGVILGPSIMGRIPKFTATIFPPESIPMLTLTSTIGLVMFMFLVGLELDIRVIRRNAKASMAISVAGLVIPLGLGAALAIPIYHEFVNPSVKFGYFVLFVAVAIGITAFPVLCRILTETKLLDTTVGTVVLSAGVGNDVVGWILLALTVALVNAGNGLTALYVLLTAVGYVLFLLYPVRIGYKWLARRSGSLEKGQPCTMMMTITLALVFISAFFTDIIGIHPIFGGFLAGLIIPHENGFAIALVERLEDLVCILFLPLYFTLSGLRTNLGFLDNGVTWGYTILIIVVAFFSKFIGCAVTAKLVGFNFRESGAVGALMSCKGLVELIVLNVGLTANILDTRTFSMFVLHAIIVTFITTPLTLFLYPLQYRTSATMGQEPSPTLSCAGGDVESRKGGFSQETFKTKFAVVLDRIEQLPAVMTLTQLLQHSAGNTFGGTLSRFPTSGSSTKSSENAAPILESSPPTYAAARISVDALRLIELTERTSGVLKSQSVDSLVHSDPILSVFRTFGHLNRMAVSTALSVIGFEEYSSRVASHVQNSQAQMVILPWGSGHSLASEGLAEGHSGPVSATHNPFEGLFGQKNAGREKTSATVHIQFVRRVFAESPADVALFMDRGLESLDGDGSHHILLPFFGGPDDRLALSLVVQLCMNPAISATVVRFTKTNTNELAPYDTIDEIKHSTVLSAHNSVFPDTVYGARDTQTRLASDTADNILWERYTVSTSPDAAEALTRIAFSQQFDDLPLHAALSTAENTVIQLGEKHSNLLVVVGRSRRMAVEAHGQELRSLCAERGVTLLSDVSKTLGDVGAAFATATSNTSLLVVQARL